MKIAHITDIHYNDSMSAEVDADAMENLNRILDDIRDREIGRVVLCARSSGVQNDLS